jgi:predicted PurR-regulated permease PerM
VALDTDPAAGETDDRMTAIWVVVVLITLIVGTAALYLGRAVLLPLATATILSIILSPVMIRLEPYFGRLFSAVLVVLTVIMVIAGVGYVLTVPLSNVADQVAGYSENIDNKLAALEKSTPPWVQHVQDAVSDVQRRVQKAAPSQHNPRTVIALPSPPSLRTI